MATKASSTTSALLVQVEEDLLQFLSCPPARLIMNEAELQKLIVLYLMNTDHYTDVHLEYTIPLSVFPPQVQNYLGATNSRLLRVDIVVERGEEFVPIELKFKTVKTKNHVVISRFGQNAGNVNLCNQGAQDEERYNYWRDVKRLEILKQNFQYVVGGIALFVTNDVGYQNDPGKESNSHNFSLDSSIVPLRTKNWLAPGAKTAKGHPNLGHLPYAISKWQKTPINRAILTDFYFTYSII